MRSRDTILSLRLVSGKLDTLTRLTVARVGCLRRGCRAGRRVQLRRCRVAASEIDTTAKIPVVTARRHLVPRHLPSSQAVAKSTKKRLNRDSGRPEGAVHPVYVHG